jgi:outer membrane protein OmpA-like peptidoglycan-associated protein
MKKVISILPIIVLTFVVLQLTSFNLYGQKNNVKHPFKDYLYLQPNIGLSQYFGSLNVKDFWNQNPKFAFGAALGYQISPIFGVRSQVMKTDLYSKRTDKNLELSSGLWDVALNLTISIRDIFEEYNEKRLLNFYLFGGLGYTFFNTTIQDISSGALANQNSGQTDLIMPLGAGASYRINYHFSVNLEYGDRTVFNGTKFDFFDPGKNYNVHYSYASAGVQIRFGAEDSDGDGVKNKIDLCPDVPGKVELAGCPDADNDGIADKDDACPEVAGKPEFKGCPDSDGDGIIDSKDACPMVAGLKALNGCPDKDGDGIADKDDKCPDVYGKKEFAGCPDRDGDGIPDKDDACPDEKGLPQYKGCPDTDGDGIPDNLDKTPDVFGDGSTTVSTEIKKYQISNVVYFYFDKSVVIPRYTSVLDEVVTSLNEHPEVSVYVDGYTGSEGTTEYNLKLSDRRAEYVVNYLVKKGIAKERLVKRYFGIDNPVGDNKTSAGRALNRRVEIKTVN